MKDTIDADRLKLAISNLHRWIAWTQLPSDVQNPYFEAGKKKQDNARVMQAQLADIGVLCAAGESLVEISCGDLKIETKFTPGGLVGESGPEPALPPNSDRYWHASLVIALMRGLIAQTLPYIERMLASQGDNAEPELVALQHNLVGAAATTPRA